MLTDINQLLQKHPVFATLANKIATRPSGLNYLQISGVTFHVQKLIVAELAKKFDSGIVVLERDIADLRRYMQSAEIYLLKSLTYNNLLNLLTNNGLSRSAKVEKKHEFSVKGDVISFWLPGYKHPIKASFFGEEMETVYFYDEIYAKPYAEVDSILLGEVTKIESEAAAEHINIFQPEKKLLQHVIIFNSDEFDTEKSFHFDFYYPQIYFNRLDILEKNLEQMVQDGYQIGIYTVHKELLPKTVQKYVLGTTSELDSGYQSTILKVLLLTDRELFGTVFLAKEVKKISSKRARKLLANLEGEIEIGDYVVHDDHGVGIYKGIKQETTTEKVRVELGKYITKEIKGDYLLIAYAEGDELYLPLSQIDKLTKYISPDDSEPKVTRLKGHEWQNIKRKVKASIEKYARELVEHYAKVELSKASEFDIEKTSGYEKFINDFPYVETPDQLRTEKEIIADIKQSKPMNRLIVGDVGFGKTEVAMRAAYLVSKNSQQVAVLCPTTILAAQHEKVFRERFKESGIEIAALSRTTKRQNTQTLADIKSGKVKIVVGTHRLLGNDVEFKKLGLIIIDEEQKFGVKQKERLKRLQYGVHVLSMSATPIPRSLSMALSSIQDISIIQTPPEGRKSIKTIVKKRADGEIVRAIMQEVERNGQIYYVHNRVQTINSTANKLQKLMPNVKFAVAHGQLPPEKLKEIIDAFYNREFDCLVCTTIIENGIDMANVNTIVIEHAQNFGLGQLYQLRGRVGRGEKQAYAFVFYDGEDIDKTIDVDALPDSVKKKLREKKYKDRLKALVEASDVGSGFKLASRDLEIRGAGNLLGKEQHGNISHMGYGLYMQMLAEEIERLRHLHD